MKKLLLLVTTIIVSISIKAQESTLKAFKVDVSAGYALPTSSGNGDRAKGGGVFVVEPKYALTNNISIGLKMETALFVKIGGVDIAGQDLDHSVKGIGCYLASGDYYFNDNYSFRPFVGTGAGLFRIANAEVSSFDSEPIIEVSSKLGGMIRGGFEAKHFRIGVDFNFVPASKFNSTDNSGSVTVVQLKNTYVGLKLGICIGGGEK